MTNQRDHVEKIEHQIVLVDEDKKSELLSYLIGSRNISQVLVFVNRKLEADDLVENLNLDGLKSILYPRRYKTKFKSIGFEKI